MPQLIFPAGRDGLWCTVVVGPDGNTIAAAINSGSPTPSAVVCRGLIDTGSDVTLVDVLVLRKLGLNQPAQKTANQTVAGVSTVNLFEVSLSILDARDLSLQALVLPRLLIGEWLHPPPDLEVLIGMDVLLDIRLVLDGPGKTYSLEF